MFLALFYPKKCQKRFFNKASSNFQQALIKEIQVIEIVSKANKKNKFKVKIELKNEEIDKKRQELGRFILATNIVDEQKLKPHEILKKYKNQPSLEVV